MSISHVGERELREHLPIVGQVLKYLVNRQWIAQSIDFEDLEAVGQAALWRALPRIDPSRSARECDVYLFGVVRSAMLDYQRSATRAEGWSRRGWLAYVTSLDQRVQLADDSETTVGELIEAPYDLETHVEARIALAAARRSARHMPDRLRVVAENLLAEAPRTHAEVGAQLGVSEARACQLARKARELMRDAA